MVKQYLSRVLFNLPGWRTRRRIVVFESDDWGSIRMPSRDVYLQCLQEGYPVDKISYERYDAIASGEDLELLFDLLGSHKDSRGNPPVLTANCVVANPDFDRIRADGFRNYHYELITETFKKYPRHQDNFNLWKQGMEGRVFHPQYHAREHLNVSLFMEGLQEGDRTLHYGFDRQMPGSIPPGPRVQGNPYVEPLRYSSLEDKGDKLQIFLEGLSLFEDLFGYKSESIIPPNYLWSSDYNRQVLEKGVRYFQGLRLMAEPVPGGRSRQHRIHLGMRNDLGQTYLVRNSLFEPSMFGLDIKDPVDHCLKEMKIAFSLNKPTIISTHRINYVGFIDPLNRDRNLKMLDRLLSEALGRWPELEFMTSDQLGRLMEFGDDHRDNY